ncbi:MAG TPA: hypothetical protein VI854_07935 [Acidimicrobiia bacterium]|nr:hypothetical protein [Acidimicrobiia bacterium]
MIEPSTSEQPKSAGDPARGPVSRLAVLAAFLAVVAGGLSGAAIGYGLVGIDCEGECGTAQGFGALIGGLIGAVGVAVVAVLVLRAMSEWRRNVAAGRPGELRRRPL